MTFLRNAAVSAALVALFVLTPSSAPAAPCVGFSGVDDSDPFCGDVEWMKRANITFRCTATSYCP